MWSPQGHAASGRSYLDARRLHAHSDLADSGVGAPLNVVTARALRGAIPSRAMMRSRAVFLPTAESVSPLRVPRSAGVAAPAHPLQRLLGLRRYRCMSCGLVIFVLLGAAGHP